MIVFGAFLLFFGTVLLFAWLSARHRLSQMNAVAISPVAELLDAIAMTLPARLREQPDPFVARPAAVEGVVRCESPLTSEFGNVPCVFYKITAKRRYRKRSRIEERRSRGVPFWVEDATGRILVDPAGADVDGLRVVDEFQSTTGQTMMLGNATLHVSAGMSLGQERGVRYRETVLPLDRPVYVLGVASTGTTEPVIRKPLDGKLLISLKSGEELVRATATATWWLLLLGLGGLAGGITLVALDLLL